MGISFSSSGSTAGNPQKGLMGNMSVAPKQGFNQVSNSLGLPSTPNMSVAPKTTPGVLPASNPQKINSNPFGDPHSGVMGSIGRATGLSPQSGYDKISSALGTNPGLLPTTPVKKITTNNTDGSSTTHEFHAPDTNGNSETSTKASSGSETSSGSNSGLLPGAKVGTSIQNAQNVLDESSLNNNAEYKKLAENENLIAQAQSPVGLDAAGKGGFNTVGSKLGPGYENLYAPQSTGNLAGEKGILSPELSAAQIGNSAEASRLLSGAGLATQGATSVLNAGLPRQNGYVNLNPFNPDTNGGGDNSAIGAASSGAQIESGASSVGTYTTQNNSIQNSIDKLDNIAIGNNSSGGLIANMGTEGFNPANTPIGNQAFSYYYKNLNPGAQAGIQAGLGDIANNVSTVLSSVTGLTPTAVSAIVDSYDFQDLTPSQLNDFLLYVKGYANNSIQANNDSINRIKSGQSVSASNGPLPAPKANSKGSALLGLGATLGEGLVNKVLGATSNAVADAAGGAAAAKGASLFGTFF